ncbi:MAG: ribosome small subunit-dependent GTPase A [Bacteroidales bacterium]|jgi:ribosome biogenesis GTPase|nr:ribosome small subunit-dependent GTPase A [Bacteroidales bacterium]
MDNSHTGLVLKSTGTWYEVLLPDGKIVNCRLRGQFRIKGIKNTNPVVVGDSVSFDLFEDNTGYITKIEPRFNYIDRKSTKLSKINHLIAANIDLAILVVTLKEPRTSLGFIDRFLIACESFRIPVCLVFNKIDLYQEQELEVVRHISAMYCAISYSTLFTSVMTGEGIDLLKDQTTHKKVLLSGHSGVGKSALLNTMYPDLQLKIGEISQYHKKGTHTTTFVQMHQIAVDTFVIDSPGIKEFGLIQYSKEEIRDYFPEIRVYNNHCKYNNCLHVHEPGCAVIEALKEEKIALSRYQNYLAILQDEDMAIEDWQLN